MENRKILIVDDNADVLLSASLLLKKHYSKIITEKNPKVIPSILNEEPCDLILLDMNFSKDMTTGSEGFYWLNKIKEIDENVVVILITAYGDIEMAVQAVHKGASDFVLKPWQNEKLLATISAALQLHDSKKERSKLRIQQKQLSADLDNPYKEIIGDSPAMRKVFETMDKVAATDANILILGENGTGKEMVARTLHRKSARAENVFISVDMGAISENLFQSELFGHVKGAFTDAREDRAGRFEIASGGTLFMDEIANLPLQLQAKLLTVLQNREVVRVGSNKIIPFDVRLICATNKPIRDMVHNNEFRQDLLFRINTVEIALPPLRERENDIELMADHFIILYSSKYKNRTMHLSKAAVKKLREYPWPGNVRELQHAVERAVIMSEGDTLQPYDFFLSQEKKVDAQILEIEDSNLDKIEKLVIERTIKKCAGNVSKAAKELGLTRAALYRRMEKHSL